MSDPNRPPHEDDRLLEPFFAAAQSDRPLELDSALTQRILAAAAPSDPAPLGLFGWLAEVRDGLGGWGALAGLGTAMVAGVWIGGAAPEMASTLTPWMMQGATTAADGVDADLELVFPSYDSLLEGI